MLIQTGQWWQNQYCFTNILGKSSNRPTSVVSPLKYCTQQLFYKTSLEYEIIRYGVKRRVHNSQWGVGCAVCFRMDEVNISANTKQQSLLPKLHSYRLELKPNLSIIITPENEKFVHKNLTFILRYDTLFKNRGILDKKNTY